MCRDSTEQFVGMIPFWMFFVKIFHVANLEGGGSAYIHTHTQNAHNTCQFIYNNFEQEISSNPKLHMVVNRGW